MKELTVTASEIGDYVYCKRGWWLRKHGLLPVTDLMISGTERHTHLSLLIRNHTLLALASVMLFFLGILGIILYLFSIFQLL